MRLNAGWLGVIAAIHLNFLQPALDSSHRAGLKKGKMVNRGRVKVFFDGGCRPNPGPIEAAVVICGEVHLFDDLGTGTNADAEWIALIRAVEVAQALGMRDFDLVGDALEVVRAAEHVLRGKSVGQAARGHADRFRAATEKAPPRRVRWIKREQNLAGIALAARHPR
jgi:ribonuclease HI